MHDLIHTLAAGNPIAENWLGSTFHDVSRYVIFAVGVWLTLWVVLQRPLAGRKIRADNPPARQMIVEFLVSIRSVAIFSTIGLATFLLDRAGWLPGPKLAASWGPAWFWGSLVLMIIAHDAYFYWAHRLLHRPQLFRAFHRRHHRSMNPTPFTAYSFDLGEAAVMASFVPAWMILVPTQWEVTGLFMLHQIVRNTMGHAGYELMPATKDGRPLFDWLTTTTHHDLHHAQAGWNYGLYFTFWDRLMGTEHPEYHARFAQAVRKPLRAPRASRRRSASRCARQCGRRPRQPPRCWSARFFSAAPQRTPVRRRRRALPATGRHAASARSSGSAPARARPTHCAAASSGFGRSQTNAPVREMTGAIQTPRCAIALWWASKSSGACARTLRVSGPAARSTTPMTVAPTPARSDCGTVRWFSRAAL
ncbi:MAG: fatty acid hydroxylase [Alphaproteobacteria bacterium]|nr:MAG: fatty acid hydroxylase [Alphaproteobacteria bacterium]